MKTVIISAPGMSREAMSDLTEKFRSAGIIAFIFDRAVEVTEISDE